MVVCATIEGMHPTHERITVRALFNTEWRGSLTAAFALLGAAYVVEHLANVYAYTYVLRPTSNYVGDIVLDNVPAIDLNFIIIECALIVIALSILYVILRPRYILFSVKAVALFIIIRAIFTSLTHVGIYPDHIMPVEFGLFNNLYIYLNFQTGLFFSGHTGMPFLMALIFWRNLRVRRIFLTLSVLFGAAVLLAHVHYSIDVFAAPFMAYGIFKIAQYLFPRDYALTAHHLG